MTAMLGWMNRPVVLWLNCSDNKMLVKCTSKGVSPVHIIVVEIKQLVQSCYKYGDTALFVSIL